jgi:hypothetical protein
MAWDFSGGVKESAQWRAEQARMVRRDPIKVFGAGLNSEVARVAAAAPGAD